MRETDANNRYFPDAMYCPDANSGKKNNEDGTDIKDMNNVG